MKNFVKVNHLERESKEFVEFIDLYEYISNNKCISQLKENSVIKNLLIKAINNGAFFRNATLRESFNYWQPLSNAGIPAVPRGDYLHESTFLIHDILHNNIPDLQLDKNDNLNKKVYYIHRILGEGICLVLADMYFIDEIKDNYTDYDFNSKKIYGAFKSIKERSMYENVKANALYSVLGITDLFKIEDDIDKDTLNYINWFRAVYLSDHKWTLNNISNISSKFSSHKKWLNDFINIINRSYKVVTTSTLINELGLKFDMSNEDLTEKIFDFIYFNYIQCKKSKLLNIEERMIKAKNIYYAFQSKIFYEFPFNETLKKEYLNSIKVLEFSECERIYNEYLNELRENRFINEKLFNLYSEVYPHFNACYISYDDSKVPNISLEEYSKYSFLNFEEA